MKNTTSFELNRPYNFDMNDIRAIIQLVSLLLTIAIGLKSAWLGLAVGVIALVRDFWNNPHARINSVVMHLTTIVLNIYLLTLS